MSQLVVPSHTLVHNIPIGRRIREIMKEKGMAFTLNAMANRMGIHRETLRKMLSGDRELYTFELEKIADELNLSVSRILQEDLKEIVVHLDAIIARPSSLEGATELAGKFLSIAIGVTERCAAHIYAGRIFFEMQEFESSHKNRLEAYTLALIINDSYGEDIYLQTTIRNLLTSFTIRKDYANAYIMMDRAKDYVGNDPHRVGEIHYTLAMIAYNSGRIVEAKGHLLKSLESYKSSIDQKEIGKALHNVAFIEYKLKNNDSARQLFEQSIATLEGYPKNKIIAVKDYIKVLFVLGENSKALRLIEESLQESCINQVPDLEAKFRLLSAIYTGQVSEAMYVVESPTVSDKLKLISCRLLMDYYKTQGESDMLMKYYIIAEQYTSKESNNYGEEDL